MTNHIKNLAMKFLPNTLIRLILVYMVFHMSCQNLDPVAITKFSAFSEIAGLTSSSANVKAKFMDVGDDIISYGHCWSTNSNPTVDHDKTINNGKPPKQVEFISTLTSLTFNTKYYVRAYATTASGTIYGNELNFTTFPLLPTVSTVPAKEITQNTAISGGNVTYDGGGNISERGICCGIGHNPDTTGIRVIANGTTGIFESNLASLTANTNYYVRAYAINASGIAYGNEISFTTIRIDQLSDIDDNVYNTVVIGIQIWMKENLRTTKYRNHESIGTTSATVPVVPTSKFQWAYGESESNASIYGRLYTWYAAKDDRNICPAGWHLPSDAEWTIMVNYLISNGYNYDGTTTENRIGKALASISNWTTSSNSGTIGNNDYPEYRNKSGFSALPGGYRSDINFLGIGNDGYWWSATEKDSENAWAFQLNYNQIAINRDHHYKSLGYSVRCLKD